MKILIINCGSSSIKYQLINTKEKTTLCKGLVKRISAVTSIIRHEFIDEKPVKKSISLENLSYLGLKLDDKKMRKQTAFQLFMRMTPK